MKSDQPTTCIKCGVVIPAGLNYREVKDDHGTVIGNRCYNKCRGVLRVESDERKELYKTFRIENLISVIRTGSQNEFLDASVELKLRELSSLNRIAGYEELFTKQEQVLNALYEAGLKQAEEWDRFWEAMEVKSAEITVEQAIKKYQAMEKVLESAKDLRFEINQTGDGRYLVDSQGFVTLLQALFDFKSMPKAEQVCKS